MTINNVSMITPNREILLKASQITKDYDDRVLHGIDLEVPRGQFLTIMGPSGSGKSTLMHILAGLDRPTTGSVQLAGQELSELTEPELADLRLKSIGFVFQHAHLMRTLDLADNIALPGLLADSPREEVLARVETLMNRMGVNHVADHGVTEVSGGQLQRAAICRALVNQPQLIMGDEPTGALNSATASQILDLLTQINQDGTTIILVTHDPKVAARADRVLLLVDGQIAHDVNLQQAGTARLEVLNQILAGHQV